MADEKQFESVVTDEMREAIGKEGGSTTLEVEKGGCRMFARAVGHTDQIFYDEAGAWPTATSGSMILDPDQFLADNDNGAEDQENTNDNTDESEDENENENDNGG